MSQKNIRFLTWNLENFFLLPQGSALLSPVKAPEKVNKIAETFKDIDPDVAFLTEVGGKDSLQKFCEEHLVDKYRFSLLKGNSNRGIELGFLIKEQFLTENNLDFEHLSHAKKPIHFLYPHERAENKKLLLRGQKQKHTSHRLSRDVAELRVFKKEDHLKKKPLFIILGVHLKSKLDKEGIDWQGQRRRAAEARYLAETYKKRKKEFHGKVPVFITGDLNGEAHENKRDPEFRDLYALEELKDFSDALRLPREECISFIGMDKKRQSFGLQLDYFFVPQMLQENLVKEHCGFYRYRNDQGGIYPLPQNPGARHGLPSDHFPLVIELKKEAFF